jgi:hypothetical protein
MRGVVTPSTKMLSERCGAGSTRTNPHVANSRVTADCVVIELCSPDARRGQGSLESIRARRKRVAVGVL